MSFAGFLDLARKDVEIPINAPKELLKKLHSDYIFSYQADKHSYEYIMAEPIRLGGIYWCVSAMDVMGVLDRIPRDDVIAYVLECHRPDGGFAPAPHHDSHLLQTLCAVQILMILDAMDSINVDSIAKSVAALQNEDGSFSGDSANEIDTRFSMVALATLHLIDRMDAIDVNKTIDYVLSCYNADGGFGTRPGSESHSGQVYCCLGSLHITGRLEDIDRNKTAEWLAQRQCGYGGVNGRPEKLPDVCYSWWVLSSLAMIRRLNWIDKDAITKFIYACQDDETGGFADRPGDYPDPFHTHFGLSGLSLLGHDDLLPVDVVFCMTKRSLGSKSLS